MVPAYDETARNPRTYWTYSTYDHLYIHVRVCARYVRKDAKRS